MRQSQKLWLVSVVDTYHPKDTNSRIFLNKRRAQRFLDEKAKELDATVKSDAPTKKVYAGDTGIYIILELVTLEDN